jgi:teichuronic acid biosynthesis glycosyltransferase TuaC
MTAGGIDIAVSATAQLPRRRVLVLTLWFPNSASPGLGAFVQQQITALSESGVDVRVVQPIPLAPAPVRWLRDSWRELHHVPEREMREELCVEHPRYLTLPRHWQHHRVGDWLASGTSATIRSIYAAWPFDIIHAHTTYPCGYAANLLRDRFLPDVRVVHTIHRTCIVDSPQWGAQAKAAVCRALDGCDHAIFVSREGHELALGLTEGRIASRASIVSNGVDPRRFTIDGSTARRAKALRNEHHDTFNLLFVGHICERKGIPELLEALALLADSADRKTKLFLVGRNEMGRGLDALMRRLGVADRVTLVGELPHERVKTWMSFADAFVLPSHSEGVPTVMFEALCVGTPTILTCVGGIADIVRDGREALLIQPGSPRAITAAIQRIMRNGELRTRLARNGRELVTRRYTWAINAGHVGAVYQQTCSAANVR